MQVFKLTHNGQTIYKGAENSCFIVLQKKQSQSAEWAIKHEGWKVEPLECSEIESVEILKADRYAEVEVKLLQAWVGMSNQNLKAELNGVPVVINTYAASPVTGTGVGDTVRVMQGYIL